VGFLSFLLVFFSDSDFCLDLIFVLIQNLLKFENCSNLNFLLFEY
jgi:hypothetical protein